MEPNRPYRPHFRDAWGVSPDLVLDFVYVYARFEYALKRAGYLKPNLEHAEADWRAFGDALGNGLARSRRAPLVQARAFLRTNPPLIQTGPESWRPFTVRRTLDDASLLLLVSQIRNGLFHGAQFPCDDASGECARDDGLLRSGLVVLLAALDLDERVKGFFCEPPEACPARLAAGMSVDPSRDVPGRERPV